MEKAFRFINNHPYIIINVVGLIVIFLCFFPGITALLGLIPCVLTYGVIHIPLYGLFLKIVDFEYCEAAIVILFALILLALNISAFICIKKDKNIAGIVLSILLGFVGIVIESLMTQSFVYLVVGFFAVGSFIGTLVNRDFKYVKAIKVIFNIQLWIYIWVAISCLLFYFEYFKLDLSWPG